MNLMFWKKKPDTVTGAEDVHRDASVNKEAQEPPDSTAAKQEAPESNSEPPEQEAPVKVGLVARMKSRFTSFARYFRKTPAFQAGEEQVSDAPGDSKTSPDDAAAKSFDPDLSAPETQAKPGLAAQIKSRFAALIQRFKKAPVPDAAEDQGKETQRRSKDDSGGTEETPEKPSLVSRVRSSLAAFVAHYKKYLMFTLLLLLLAGIVYSVWDIIFPPLVRKPTPHKVAKPDIEAPAPQAHEPASQVQEAAPQAQESVPQAPEQTHQAHVAASQPQEAAPLTDIKAINKSEEARARAEALKKQSEEMQAQAEALRNESEVAQARAEELRKKEEEEKARAEALRKKSEAEKKARTEALRKSSRQQLPPGEIAVGSSDAKASTQSLKEAIEAMNDGSGGRTQKPAR